jgi:CRISP-associated protein Cas1
MPTACVITPDCRIQLESERLIIRRIRGSDEESAAPVEREIPIRDVERVLLDEGCSITSPALSELLRRDIPVTVIGRNGNVLGAFNPITPAHGAARIRHYKCSLDPAFNLRTAGRIVTAKLYNQRRILQRIALGRSPESPDEPSTGSPDPEISASLTWLDNLFVSIRRAADLDELRGYEGAATARYFQAWARLLPPAFPFERRSTRPPQNPVNACISFGATLLYNEMAAACLARGLDPAIGALHTTEDGRWSLALDLMEPFRPALVEALTLDLFSRNMVDEAFSSNTNVGWNDSS